MRARADRGPAGRQQGSRSRPAMTPRASLKAGLLRGQRSCTCTASENKVGNIRREYRDASWWRRSPAEGALPYAGPVPRSRLSSAETSSKQDRPDANPDRAIQLLPPGGRAR